MKGLVFCSIVLSSAVPSVSDHQCKDEPEVLSFRDKLNLHKKVVGELGMGAARPHSSIITDDELTIRRKDFTAPLGRPCSVIITDNEILQHRKSNAKSDVTPSDNPCSIIIQSTGSNGVGTHGTHGCHSAEVSSLDNRNNNCSIDSSISPYIASVLASQPVSTLQIPDDADIPQTEEHLKRKAWRDRMAAALQDQVLQAELAIRECEYQSPVTRSTVSDEQCQGFQTAQNVTMSTTEQCLDVCQKTEEQTLVEFESMQHMDILDCRHTVV